MTQEDSIILVLKEEVSLILKNLPLFKLNYEERKYKKILAGNTKFNTKFGDYKLAFTEMKNKPFWFLWTIGSISIAFLIKFTSIYTMIPAAEFAMALLLLIWFPSLITFTTYYQMSLLKINSYMKFNRIINKIPSEYFNDITSMNSTIFKIENDVNLKQKAREIIKNMLGTEIYRIESSIKRIGSLELSLAFISTIFSGWIVGKNSLLLIKALFVFFHLPQVVESLNHEKVFAVLITISTLIYRDILQKSASERVIKLKKSIEYLEIFNQ